MTDTLAQIAAARRGKTLVFTNGVFDILHAGHVRYLAQARELGDLLVIGVNTDESVRRLGKAPDRPVNPLEDRIAVLSALRAVDFAIPFSEDTPETLIAQIKPDIHVKGGDYTIDQLPETPLVQGYGGKVVILPFLTGKSTTSVIEKIRGTILPD